jgi:hypothetical protein
MHNHAPHLPSPSACPTDPKRSAIAQRTVRSTRLEWGRQEGVKRPARSTCCRSGSQRRARRARAARRTQRAAVRRPAGLAAKTQVWGPVWKKVGHPAPAPAGRDTGLGWALPQHPPALSTAGGLGACGRGTTGAVQRGRRGGRGVGAGAWGPWAAGERTAARRSRRMAARWGGRRQAGSCSRPRAPQAPRPDTHAPHACPTARACPTPGSTHPVAVSAAARVRRRRAHC